MPKHPGRIDEVGDAQPPGLNRRWLWIIDTERRRKVQTRNVFPPCIEIVDHQLHHEVPGETLFKVVLKDKTARADSEDCHIAVQQLFKAKLFVERLAEREVTCR